MRGQAAILLVLGCGLACGGANALAQGGGSESPAIGLPSGCLTSMRVTIRIVPKANTMLSPVHVRAAGYEQVHLTGVTQEASVTVRLPHEGRLSVTGETTGGERFSVVRNYHRCTPAPPPEHNNSPSPPITGGGEG